VHLRAVGLIVQRHVERVDRRVRVEILDGERHVCRVAVVHANTRVGVLRDVELVGAGCVGARGGHLSERVTGGIVRFQHGAVVADLEFEVVRARLNFDRVSHAVVGPRR